MTHHFGSMDLMVGACSVQTGVYIVEKFAKPEPVPGLNHLSRTRKCEKSSKKRGEAAIPGKQKSEQGTASKESEQPTHLPVERVLQLLGPCFTRVF